ncbi:hypothetical protein LCGC14_2344390 [marine sediment metagenome]|uniref:AAA domain-containing protein n=1 Tax=marine sediment metagenome TaxID=412755 RepID=A0A0F9CAY1_9ZZZZ
MAHIIVVGNEKGGSGKSTTSMHVATALARMGHRVGGLDLDLRQKTFGRYIENRREYLARAGFDLPSPEYRDLPEIDQDSLAPGENLHDRRLSAAVSGIEKTHDFILIDCPPSLGLLTINALAAASDVIIPLQPHFLALQGLGKLLETISLVCKHINPSLRVTGVLLCMYESVTRLTTEVVADLRSFFDTQRRTDKPWAHARIFQTVIRRNIKLAECPSYGKTIFEYEPRSHGAADYNALADEFLSCFTPERPAEASELPRPASHTQPPEPGLAQSQ